MNCFKRPFLFLTFFLFLSKAFSATCASLFYYDEDKIYNEFKSVSLIENAYWENKGTISQFTGRLQKKNSSFICRFLNDTSETESPLMGIPSFYWGFAPGFAGGFFAPCTYGSSCILGPSGVFMIYLVTDKSKEETKQSIYGCASGTALGAMTSITAILFFYGYLLFSLQ